MSKSPVSPAIAHYFGKGFSDMTDCQTLQTGTITGMGVHRKMSKALSLAYKDAKDKGRKACIGGTCGVSGTSCTDKFETGRIIFPEERDQDGNWLVVVESDGRCRCE